MTEPRKEDRFIRYARPFLVWVTGVSVFATVIFVMVAFLLHPGRISDITQLVSSISSILMVATGASGVYVWKRSQDKKIKAEKDQDRP